MEAEKKEEQIIRGIQKGLLQWYDFQSFAKVLFVGEADSPLAECMKEKGLEVVCVAFPDTLSEEWKGENKDKFDYLVSMTDLEKHEEPIWILSQWKRLMKSDGHLLIGMNNRLGLRYFCGDRDCYTERNMDGIEDYRRAYVRKEDVFRGRMYDRNTLKEMLKDAGLDCVQFFSVLSDLYNPAHIFAEDYLPNEDLANRVFPTYHSPDTVFLDEEPLYEQMIRNGMFHQTANAYLIECALDGELSDVNQVTASTERGRENALFTVIYKSGMVEKRAAYAEGRERLGLLEEHGRDLEQHGLRVIAGKVEDGIYRMPYVSAQSGQLYLKELLFQDKGKFLEAMDHFRDLILQSSEIEKADTGDGEGAVLRRGYLDLIPLNSFFIDGEFVFYDQEFCEEHYPANVLLLRMVSSFYLGNAEFQKILPREEMFHRYGLMPNLEHWYTLEWNFLNRLLNRKELLIYHEKCRRNNETVNANRQRMNYSETEYQRLFMDIFKGVKGRKLILFGAGTFTKRYLGLYKRDYPVYAIIDNEQDKWGQELEGITIHSPDILKQLPPEDYKVFICVKNYLSIVRQMRKMGVKNYSVFDPSKSYSRKDIIQGGIKTTGSAPGSMERETETAWKDTGAANGGVETIEGRIEVGNSEERISKKYNIGYVAGVFDMFHAGHLNMFRKAKEQCDYLIVGVVSDEGVYRKKKHYPVIPCEDRLEIVRACRYVDQAEELPAGFDSIRDAHKLFQFDCQFSGTDYADSPNWLADKEYLERQGAELVFFPYTERVSSTKLREKLGK